MAQEMNWPAERVQVIPNPIAADVLAKALRQEPDQEAIAEDPVVLFTGRLAVVKGTVPLLQSILMVRRGCPELRVSCWRGSGRCPVRLPMTPLAKGRTERDGAWSATMSLVPQAWPGLGMSLGPS